MCSFLYMYIAESVHVLAHENIVHNGNSRAIAKKVLDISQITALSSHECFDVSIDYEFANVDIAMSTRYISSYILA